MVGSELGRLRRPLIGAAVALFVIASITVMLNVTSLPLKVGRKVAQAIEDQTGWVIDVEEARLVGPSRLRLEGVEFASPDGLGVRGDAVWADVAINLLGYLIGRDDDGVRTIGSIEILRPRIQVPEGLGLTAAFASGVSTTNHAPSPNTNTTADEAEPAKARRSSWQADVRIIDGFVDEVDRAGRTMKTWRIRGEFDVTAGETHRFSVKDIHLQQVGGGFSFDGRLERSRGGEPILAWNLSGRSSSITELVGPFLERFSLDGMIDASGELALDDVTGDIAVPLKGVVGLTMGSGTFAFGDRPDELAAFESLEAHVQFDDDWHLEHLAIASPHGMIVASGTSDSAFSELDLQVEAQGLNLPDDLPIVARFGMEGKTDFSGRIEGTIDAPKLVGTLHIEDGAVWGRPVSSARGNIELTDKHFSFGQARLENEPAVYWLEGQVALGLDPIDLTIDLEASNGRIEEVLAAAGVDEIAVGEFNGRVAFENLDGELTVEGDVDARSLEVAGQQLESAEAQFMWAQNSLRLDRAQASLGSGLAYGSGSMTDGHLDFDVTLDNWPLDMGGGTPLTIPDGLSGMMSLSGRLEGRASDPVFRGLVTDGRVTLGAIRLLDPTGPIELSRRAFVLDGVTVRAAGDGEYRLSGVVEGWENDPEFDLTVNVLGASLGQLFEDGGWTLPAILLDGQVTGSVELKGRASTPSAQFDLALGDDLNMSDPIRLRFEIEDGRLRLGNLPGRIFSSLAGSLVGG